MIVLRVKEPISCSLHSRRAQVTRAISLPVFCSLMSASTGKSSPYAFYAFYQLYRELGEHAPSQDISFEEICTKLYPDVVVDTRSSTSLFVTWEKRSKKQSRGYNLRGCIGTFAKLPVLKGIERYSLIAALQDRRFPPIKSSELAQLRCSCNILQNFQTIYDGDTQDGDIFNWELGVHGVELLFKNPYDGSVCSATFLPDVMLEQDWDKEETFINLLEKAGVTSGSRDIMSNYRNYFVTVIKYESNKSFITYEEFIDGLARL
mgnify:CR=1 FL=1